MNSSESLNNFLSILADNFLIPFYFSVLIGVPSVVLYTLEVWLLFKHRADSFESTFYGICGLRAIVSILGYIGSYMNARLPKIGVLALIGFYNFLPKFLYNIIYFFHFYPFHLENIATSFLLLNRFTAITMPLKYKKLWHQWYPLIFVLIITLPLPFTYHIFTLDIYLRFEQDKENRTFTLDYMDKANKPKNATLGAYSAVAFMIVCFVLNVANIVAYKCKSTHSIQQNYKGLESWLTKYAVLTFFGQLLMAIYYVLIHFAVQLSVGGWDLPFLAIYNQYPWVNDIGTVVAPAWIFIWACEPMRRHVFAIWSKIFEPQNNTVTPFVGGH